MPDAPPRLTVEAEIKALSPRLIRLMAQLVLAGWNFTRKPDEIWMFSHNGNEIGGRLTLEECIERVEELRNDLETSKTLRAMMKVVGLRPC